LIESTASLEEENSSGIPSADVFVRPDNRRLAPWLARGVGSDLVRRFQRRDQEPSQWSTSNPLDPMLA
jgi:hypothetical protein